MEEALYSKHGFFTNEKVRSKKSGDFLTSPEVSEYFGKIMMGTTCCGIFLG